MLFKEYYFFYTIKKTRTRIMTNNKKTTTGKKRGRKPKEKVVIPDEYFQKKEIVENDENIILTLPLSVINNDTTEENHPVGILYDDNYYSIDSSNEQKPIFINVNNIVNNQQEQTNVNLKEQEEKYNQKIEQIKEQRKGELIKTQDKNDTSIFLDFQDANTSGVWPSSTSIDCLWCTFPFNNKPVGLPLKKENDKFTMFGNFCCAGCAAAYNFDNTSTQFELWERYSFLNYIYGKGNNSIKIAPPRLALKKFGGKLSIDEFRSKTSENENYEVILPPMRSIIPTLEEITIDADKDYMIGFENDMLNKNNQELRLKRTKPLPSSHNTLENCMNLTYVNS